MPDPVPPREIFRAYDIRGIAGTQLGPQAAGMIGTAIATKAIAAGADRFAIAQDGRVSSPGLAQALAAGIRATGLDTIDIGQCTTPAAYWAACEHAAGNAAVITGSHNPKEYNGVKIMIRGSILAGDEIQQLYRLIAEDRMMSSSKQGTETARDISSAYIASLLEGRSLARPVKVVVDCGNGVSAKVAPQALRQLGCEVEALYAEVDGTFPNHHPDPADPANFADAIELARATEAEIAIAFDGDGDRIGVALPSGEIIYPDRLLMLLARDFLSSHSGETIVYDVKCTSLLKQYIAEHGGEPLMCRTGHSFVKQKMTAVGASLGGEMSGHIFFDYDSWGADDAALAAVKIDDALLATVKIISLVAGCSSAGDLFAQAPSIPSTPELQIALTAQSPGPDEIVAQLIAAAKFDPAPEAIITLDGLRAEWPDGFGLMRASQTSKRLSMRFEGQDQAALTRIKSAFDRNLQSIDRKLRIP